MVTWRGTRISQSKFVRKKSRVSHTGRPAPSRGSRDTMECTDSDQAPPDPGPGQDPEIEDTNLQMTILLVYVELRKQRFMKILYIKLCAHH